MSWLIFFSSLFSLPSLAARPPGAGDGASCKSMNYQSQLGPVRNQGQRGWCFAYAAADMASQKMKAPASAVDIVNSTQRGQIKQNINGHQNMRERDLSYGGYSEADRKMVAESYDKMIKEAADRPPIDQSGGAGVKEALEMANKLGFCKEKDVPSEGGEQSMLTDKTIAEDKLRKVRTLREPPSVSRDDCPPGKKTGVVGNEAADMSAISREAWTKAINDKCEMYKPG